MNRLSCTASIEEALAALEAEFDALGDWEERYRYLIDLGRTLPQLQEAEYSEANKVRGCASQVWLVTSAADGRLEFRGDSDAHIVRGLIAVLLSLYSGRTPAAILAFAARPALEQLGLPSALSAQRANGLFAMVERIRREAADQAARPPPASWPASPTTAS
ncbi:MAG TPA: SufE family protein [Caulobacteraceae bacterium]|nr:SufE family protein [Caulobacteraceae bacterium]